MNTIKNFLSHFLALIFFISMLLFTLTCLAREIITYNNLYNALEDSRLLENEFKTNSKLKELNISEDLYSYIEIEDLLYEYFTNRFLLEANLIDKKPVIDKIKINERIAIGLEKYIDNKLKETNIDINENIKNLELDKNVLKEVQKYIEDKTKIDLSNSEYISNREVKYIESYADEIIEDIRESTYVFDIIDVISNNTYITIYIIAIIVSLVLIALINLNIIPAISLLIMPILIHLIIYVAIVFASMFINLGGNAITLIINSLIDEVSVVAFKYFIIFIGLLLLVLMLQLIAKLIYAKILKKKGITTEDNVLDDYDEIDKKEEK